MTSDAAPDVAAADRPGREGPAARTPRLAIEPLRVSHAALLFPMLADPGLYTYAPDTRRATVDALVERFAALERGAPEGEGEDEIWLNWWLQRLDTGEPIGTLQATVVPGRHAWIGYSLVPAAWGHGFASEAVAWLLAELPRRHRLAECRASVDVRNLRSIALLERLGFERIGTAPAELDGEATVDHLYRRACDAGA